MKVRGLRVSALLLITIASAQSSAQIDEDLGVEQPVCHDTVIATGGELTSKERARRSADDGWMNSVRFDYGERYVDMTYAKDVRHLCMVSSLGVGFILKKTYFRCIVTAMPCQAPSKALEHMPLPLFEETARYRPSLFIRPEPDALEPSAQSEPQSVQPVPKASTPPEPEHSTPSKTQR
jgi:hypothetical protein